MQYTRETAIARLMESYKAYYDIHMFSDGQIPVKARCDFFEHSQKYVLSKKAELWSADCEEFLYLLDIPHLTLEMAGLHIRGRNGTDADRSWTYVFLHHAGVYL